MIPGRYEERQGYKEKVCFNCLTKETPLWRRSKKGVNLCNACGLYYRNHGEHRPISKAVVYQNHKGLDKFQSKIGFLENIAIAALTELRQKAYVVGSDDSRKDLPEHAGPYMLDTGRLPAGRRSRTPDGSIRSGFIGYDHMDPRTFRVPERTGRISGFYSMYKNVQTPKRITNRYIDQMYSRRKAHEAENSRHMSEGHEQPFSGPIEKTRHQKDRERNNEHHGEEADDAIDRLATYSDQ